LILFIKELAGYERLSHEVGATEAVLRRTAGEVVVGSYEGRLAGFASSGGSAAKGACL